MRNAITLIHLLTEIDCIYPIHNPEPVIKCKIYEDNESCIVVSYKLVLWLFFEKNINECQTSYLLLQNWPRYMSALLCISRKLCARVTSLGRFGKSREQV